MTGIKFGSLIFILHCLLAITKLEESNYLQVIEKNKIFIYKVKKFEIFILNDKNF